MSLGFATGMVSAGTGRKWQLENFGNFTHTRTIVSRFRADDLKCSTPAMVASKYAKLECLGVLKAFRCNINMRDIYGNSILYEKE